MIVIFKLEDQVPLLGHPISEPICLRYRNWMTRPVLRLVAAGSNPAFQRKLIEKRVDTATCSESYTGV